MGAKWKNNMNGYKSALSMVVLQFLLAGHTLLGRAAILRGMNPRVYVVYRQTIATILIAPVVCFSRWKNPNKTSLGLKGFCLIFFNSLIGITANHNAFVQGLKLSSSSIATAMTNLMPAITFVMACLVGFEKVNVQSLKGIAKIMGTVICVGGAIVMALVKGPTLLNSQSLLSKPTMGGGSPENLQLGCLFLFVGCGCWSFWTIMQVPVSATCPDHLYSILWMCFLSMVQSAIFTWSMEHNLEVWALNSALEIRSCLYAGSYAAASYLLQTWCVSQRGPVFSAVFSPLCTVITTAIATSFLHEELYTESLIGAFPVIIGLYVVLWGKGKDLKEMKQQLVDPPEQDHGDVDEKRLVDIAIDDSSEKINHN